MLGAPTMRHIHREHYTPSGCDHWLLADTLGTLKNSLYFFSNFQTDWEQTQVKKMKIKMSALIVKLDLQQTRLAKTFQWSKCERLNPLTGSTAPTGLRFPPRAPPGQSLLMGDRVGALLKSRAIPSMKPARPSCLYRLSPPFPDLTRHGSLGFSLLCNCHCTLAVVWKPSELWVGHKQAGGIRG